MISSNLNFLNLRECDLSDHIFDIFESKTENISNLTYLINNHLTLPIIAQKQTDKYRIIYGFDLVRLYRKNQTQIIAAYILSQSVTIKNLLSIIVEYHSQCHNLYPIEIARILHIAKANNISDEDIAKEILPEIGYIQTGNMTGQVLKLKNIHPDLVNFLIDKNAPLKLWLFIKDFEPLAQKIFAKIVANLKPSLSIFEEITRNLKEISLRDKKTIIEIINELQIEEIISGNNKTFGDKLSRIREDTEKIRYPIVTKYRENIQKIIETVRLPSKFQIQIDKTFEQKYLKLGYTVKSENDIEALREFFSGEKFEKLRELYKKL
jgi:hypothetical protein